jgi:hypothetical protein
VAGTAALPPAGRAGTPGAHAGTVGISLERSLLELLRGRAADIVHMAEGLVPTRGVKYGRVVPATTGETLR